MSPVGFKAKCIAWTHSLAILKPSYLCGWVSGGSALKPCCVPLINCLVNWYIWKTWEICCQITDSNSKSLEYFKFEFSLTYRDYDLCYLHCTSRSALALAVKFNPFSAKHQYLPDWFLLVFIMLRVSPEATASPSLTQLIFGTGFPMALQWKVTLAASRTVLSLGVVVKLGETKTDKYM